MSTSKWFELFDAEQKYNGPFGESHIESQMRQLRGLSRLEGMGRPSLSHLLESFQWLQILRIGYVAYSADQRQRLHSPLVGLSRLGQACAYLLTGNGDTVKAFWGIEGSNLHIQALQAALAAAWSEVVTVQPNFLPGSTLDNFQAARIYSGIPSEPIDDPLKNQQAGWAVIDAFLQSMRGTTEPWAWLLLFKPLQAVQIADWYTQAANRIEDIQISYLQPNTSTSFSRAAQGYKELLEAHLGLLEKAFAEGGWLVYGLALSTPGNMQYLQAAMTSAFGGPKSRPEQWRLRSAGKIIQIVDDWRGQLTFLPSGSLSLMADLPRQEHPGLAVGRVVPFDLVPPITSANAKDPLLLGNVLDGQRKTQQSFALDLGSLSSHLFVAGITGSGKSNTIKLLLDQVQLISIGRSDKVRILIIEPVKREYRQLPGLRRYSLGEPECDLRLNPFTFEGVSCSTHLDHLKALFAAAYVLYPPMPYILEQALHEVYEDRGWDLISGFCWRSTSGVAIHERAWPTLTDLHRKVGEVIVRSGYGPRLEPEIRAALEVRINNLRLGTKGELLDTRLCDTLDTLTDQPTVLELQGIGDPEQRAFLLGLLLTKIYEGCIKHGPSSNLHLLVVLEEAHRLLEAKSGPGSEDVANPQSKAIQTFADMLAEMRAYGVGLIIAEQSPSRITRQVLKNTASKISHQLVDAEEWKLMAGSMALTEEEGQALAILMRGQAVIFTPQMDRPICVRVNPAREVTNRQHIQAPAQSQASQGLNVTQYKDAHLGALQRILADDKQVVTAYHHLFYAWLLEDEISAKKAWEKLIQEIKGAVPQLLSTNQPFLFALITRLGEQIADQLASRAGRLFGWSFDIEYEAFQRLKKNIIDITQQGFSLPDIVDLQRWWKTHIPAERPFAGCRDCPAPCQYRLFTQLAGGSQLLLGMKEIRSYKNSLEVSFASEIIEDVLRRMLPEETKTRKAAALCITSHQAHLLSYPNTEQVKQVSQVVTMMFSSNEHIVCNFCQPLPGKRGCGHKDEVTKLLYNRQSNPQLEGKVWEALLQRDWPNLVETVSETIGDVCIPEVVYCIVAAIAQNSTRNKIPLHEEYPGVVAAIAEFAISQNLTWARSPANSADSSV